MYKESCDKDCTVTEERGGKRGRTCACSYGPAGHNQHDAWGRRLGQEGAGAGQMVGEINCKKPRQELARLRAESAPGSEKDRVQSLGRTIAI